MQNQKVDAEVGQDREAEEVIPGVGREVDREAVIQVEDLEVEQNLKVGDREAVIAVVLERKVDVDPVRNPDQERYQSAEVDLCHVTIPILQVMS